MSESLDVIIVDDDPAVCQTVSGLVTAFYTWGNVLGFTDFHEAASHCLHRPTGVAVFLLDAYLGEKTAFSLLEKITQNFPMAYEDTIIMTGYPSDDLVNTCLAMDIPYLLEKPVRPYALQLAVRAIVNKYIKFAKRLLDDPDFVGYLPRF